MVNQGPQLFGVIWLGEIEINNKPNQEQSVGERVMD